MDPIKFPFEFDKFDPTNLTTVEDLDQIWSELTKQNFDENTENREKLTKLLEERLKSEDLEESVKILVGDGSLELFYLKILRAGARPYK
jgi:hypothetical protein